jgi:hypothetical protein
MLGRRLGVEGARGLTTAGSLDVALSGLEGTAYAAAASARDGLEAAQHAVAAVLLLELRTLAGWLPRGALEPVRALAGWFELANVEDRLAFLEGGELRPAFDLGPLGLAWSQISVVQSPGELCEALRASPWGDPGGEAPDEVHLALRLGWARRVLSTVPEAATWAAGGLALLLAREATAGAGRLDRARERMPSTLGSRWPSAGSVEELRRTLPAYAAWPLAGVELDGDLWQAEAQWWRRVEQDAEQLVRGPLEGRGVVVGVIALLALDAARVGTALGAAALGSSPAAREALDALL